MSCRGTVVIVTGSRKWTDEDVIHERLSRYPRGTILLHGGAVGADSIAACMGRRFDFQVVCVPYFSDAGKMGGHDRNVCLVAVGAAFERSGLDVYVEAFPLPDSRGTWDCVTEARAVLARAPTINRGGS